MTEYIYTKCPTCHSEYQVSLDVVSSGKSKARCGKCRTSFVIKENMVNHSFLHSSNNSLEAEGGTYQVDKSNQLDNLDINEEDTPENRTPINSDYGKEWSDAISEMAEESASDYLLEDAELAQHKQSKKTIKRDTKASANRAPAYYVSTRSNTERPLERHQLKSTRPQQPEPKQPKLSTPYVASFLWFIGCLGLLLLLIAQYVVFNLDNLIKEPSSRAQLEHFCTIMVCSLPHADSSEVDIINTAHKPNIKKRNRTDIFATVNNSSIHEQFVPNIKVQVYNNNSLQGELVATPDEYLLTPQRLVRPSQPITFMLTVKVKPENISHVKITPFY